MTGRCPCLSGETLENCCGRYLSGEENAPTAERLMRSRFSAFALNEPAYLLRTWHLSTRPSTLELDPEVRWYRLDILDRLRGSMFDVDGEVEFEAFYRRSAERGSQHERSSFTRENGSWYYVGAAIA